MKYLEISQERRPELHETIFEQALYTFRQEIKEFAFGGTVNMCRVRTLSSGLDVALRVFRGAEREKGLDDQIHAMEMYCQNAADTCAPQMMDLMAGFLPPV